MKGKFFFLALSAMALATGCSNDEMTEVNRGDGIDFSVTAGKLTRAEATTTSSINEFNVWAFTDGKTYMNGTTVNKGTDSKWTYTGTKFWPETSVDFFAVSPATPKGGTVSVTNESKTINYTANGIEDLLYAANFNETKDKHATSPVTVNFRHALSQIVFKVRKTSTSSINVKVKGIKVVGVANTSTLTWATSFTGDNLSEKGITDTETGDSWGTWATPTGETSYTAVDLADASEVTTTASFLTSDAGNGALFLMPQTLKPWLTLSDKGEATITGTARLLVNCQITDELSGIQLWPETGGEFAEVAISLSNPTNDPNKTEDDPHERWMQGKKYIYTLIFGEGGGYKPDPDPDDPDDPEPVLVPITFTVTVDEFQDGGKYDVNVNNPE